MMNIHSNTYAIARHSRKCHTNTPHIQIHSPVAKTACLALFGSISGANVLGNA